MNEFGGYTSKLLRINLDDQTSKEESTPTEWMEKYIGGRGFGARFYHDEITPEIEPYSPANKLFLFTGPLSGTIVPDSGKYECITKSPITGGYMCSNASGFVAPELKKAGYDGIIISGKAESLIYIVIKNGSIGFKPADHLQGKPTSETQKIIKEEMGEKTARVLCIGPAGERLVRFACIQTDHRTFGRGGAGAVMGSKNLKAIGVKGDRPVEVYDPPGLRNKLTELFDSIKGAADEYRPHGTIYIIDMNDEHGVLAANNFQKAVHNIAADKIGFKAMKDYFISHTACFNCSVACGKLLEAKRDPYRGIKADLDYELIWALGPNCGIYDLSPVIAAVNYCDEAGMDGISAGVVTGFAMELYERGILSQDDVGDLDLKFGNDESLMTLLKLITERKGIGDILAEETYAAAMKISRGAINYVMHSKKQSFTGWEPRGMTGMALAFATSNRGACHNVGGWTGRDELITESVDKFGPEGKAQIVKMAQDTRAFIDSLGICTYMRSPLGFKGDNPKAEILNLTTGIDFSDQLLLIGERIYNLERLILTREGITRKDDDLPQRIKTEKILVKEVETRFNDAMLQTMLDEYYQLRGWDNNGIPTAETLKRLEIP
ncbi:aldehyde ferredoxin oxidoreductase family protein [[Eubacterium] cellulosolvens]